MTILIPTIPIDCDGFEPFTDCLSECLTCAWNETLERPGTRPEATIYMTDFGGIEGILWLDQGVFGPPFVPILDNLLTRFESGGFRARRRDRDARTDPRRQLGRGRGLPDRGVVVRRRQHDGRAQLHDERDDAIHPHAELGRIRRPPAAARHAGETVTTRGLREFMCSRGKVPA